MDASVEGWVLHARPYRESSQLVELLTDAQGRVGVIARASRGSRRAVVLQPLCRYRLGLTGRGELRRAQGIEPAGPAALLAGRPLYAALYVNELLVRLLHRDVPLPGVFEAYGATLAALEAGGELESVLRLFEKRLLDELGYGHRYAWTLDDSLVEPDRDYAFDPDSGVFVAAPGLPAAQRYRGSALIALEQGIFSSPEDLRDAKRLMRRALAPHLGDRPLASRALFRPVAATPVVREETSP